MMIPYSILSILFEIQFLCDGIQLEFFDQRATAKELQLTDQSSLENIISDE